MLRRNKNNGQNNQNNNQANQINTGITPERIQYYEIEKEFRKSKTGFPKTELLEAGGIAQWLQIRAKQLIDESDNNRMHGGFSQLLGLSVGVGAFALTGTAIAPLAPIAISLGLFSYAASVADSAFRLGRILPIPFSGFTLQKLATSTSADGREVLEAMHDDTDPERRNKLTFLSTAPARELEMIVDYQGMLLELLDSIPEGKRFAVYFTLRKACVEGGFGNEPKAVASELNKMKDRIQPDTTLDAELMEHIKLQLNPVEEEQPAFTAPKTFIEKMQFRLPMDEVRQEELEALITHQPEELIPSLAAEPSNLIICSPGGGGKGIVISNALREFKKQHPDVHIFYIDPKADPKEKGYFEGIADTYKSFKSLGADPQEAVNAYESFWEEFYKVEGRKLLILDEATTMGINYSLVKKSDVLKGRIGQLPSLGGSQGITAWIVCQNPHVADLGINTGILSQFARLALLCTKKGEASASFDMMKRTKFTANDKYFWDDVRVLCDKSPRDRAFFYSKFDEWLPMPELTNYSGYDRDSNTFINPPQQPEPLPASEAPTIIQNPTQQPPIIQNSSVDNTANKLDKLFNEGLDSKYADVSEDGLLILTKLKECVADSKGEPIKVKAICDKHPLGKDRKSAKEIRYYLGELIIANLIKKIGDEPSEMYLPSRQ
ncbi:MAG: hypothetical protein AAF063_13045 [Cyanobacteria bacterium J06643_5]